MSQHSSIQQLTARPWLPPLSIASIIGVVLFLLYIGSAVVSFISDIRMPLWMGDAHTLPNEDEAEYCRNTWRRGSHDRRQRLYVQPHGDVSQQFTTLAMAQNAAARLDASLVVVWSGQDQFDSVPDDSWDDAFRASDVTPGCFPGQTRSRRRAKCYVQDVRSGDDWEEFVSWVHRKKTEEHLCVSSLVSLSDMPAESSKNKDTPWTYYEKLRPSDSIERALDAFQKENDWDASWGYWVGIDVAAQYGKRPDDIVDSVMYQFKNVQRGEKDKDGLRVLLMVEDKEVEAMLFDRLVFEFPQLASSKRLVSADAVLNKTSLRRNQKVSKVWLESLCHVVVTMGGFEECSAASRLQGNSLDYCVTVNNQ
ncbi:hypothetical protein M9435_005154 [Picochlorum sp. BPE23]|nr:hypothetical protein M9435_005154 [Picochlorum sp. BPE23]